jgi:ATP-binding cassette subfamily B protein
LLHISTRINLSILTDFLIKLMKLPLSFFDSKHTGDILQRMNDHSRIESFLTGSSLNTLFSLINLIVFSVVLAVFNVNIFIVFLLASFLYAAWVLLFLKKRKVLDYKRFEIQAREQSATIQLIQGMQEIKLNGIEKQMRWAWEGLQARLFTLSMKGLSLNQWQQAGAFFVNEGKNIIITFLAAKAVIDGQMTLGSMLAVQYIIGQLNSPIEQMIGFAQSWQNAKISMDRLNEIHTMENEEPEGKEFQYNLPAAFARKVVGGASPAPPVEGRPTHRSLPVQDVNNIYDTPQSVDSNWRQHSLPPWEVTEGYERSSLGLGAGAVSFRNLSFTYPGAGNEPVLKDINLSIPAGKTTAIVGTSGSGKTTLLKLLLKIYEPQKGDIRLDNTSLSNISHAVNESF